MEPLGIAGAYVTTPRVHDDDRGSFHEWFRSDRLSEAIGHDLGLVQANCAVSRRGVLRGIHFAAIPPGQAKYIICVSGAFLDVVVDLRVGSPDYGRYVTVEMNDQNRRALYVSEGLGHGYLALTDCTAIYLCSDSYRPDREHSVDPLDPELAIKWPGDLTPILSPRDAAAPSLAQARADGLLPDYQECLDLYAKLAQ